MLVAERVPQKPLILPASIVAVVAAIVRSGAVPVGCLVWIEDSKHPGIGFALDVVEDAEEE